MTRDIGSMPFSLLRDIMETNHPTFEKTPIAFASFSGIYPDQEIRDDMNEVKKKTLNIDKKGLKGESEPEAKFLEKNFGGIVEQYKWFGDNARCIRCSTYDDLLNGGDYVIEWDIGGKILRLKVDIATGEHMQKKLQKITDNAARGTLGHCKYFHSELNPNVQGSINRIPEVVIQLNEREVENFTRDIVQDPSQLQRHYLKGEILKLIHHELAAIGKTVATVKTPEWQLVKNQCDEILKRVIDPLIQKKDYDAPPPTFIESRFRKNMREQARKLGVAVA